MLTREQIRSAIAATPAVGAEVVVSSTTGPDGLPLRVSVRPLTITWLWRLVQRFPAIQAALAGKGSPVSVLADIGDDAVSALVSAAVGFAGDAEIEAAVSRWSEIDRIEIALRALKLTVGGDIENFSRRFLALGVELGALTEFQATVGMEVVSTFLREFRAGMEATIRSPESLPTFDAGTTTNQTTQPNRRNPRHQRHVTTS
jgi:hypothetical protein